MEYLYIGIVVLILVVLLLVSMMKRRQFRKPSTLVTLTMTLIVFGIIFSDAGRLISYSFFGVAVLLSIIDIFRIQKTKKSSI
jgi:hypothetical protein